MGDPQGFDRKEFISRIGTFFLLVGIGLLVLFVLSEMAEKTDLSYFCWGTIILVLGFVFRAQYKAPPPAASGRFGILKKLTFKRKPKEEKAKK